jgi:ABC-type Fe3+ transport system permease subunit
VQPVWRNPFVAPVLIYIGLVLFVPLVAGLVQAVRQPGAFGWYMVAIRSRDFWGTVGFTLAVALISTACSALLATLTSLWLWLRLPASRVVFWGLTALLLLPEFTVAAVWYLALLRLDAIGDGAARLSEALRARPLVLFALVDGWRGWPALTLVLLAGLRSLTPAQVEAVRLLGAREVTLARFVLQAIGPFWRVGILVRLLQGIQLFGTASLLSPASHPGVLAREVLTYAGAYRQTPAVAWIGMLVVLLLAALLIALMLRPLKGQVRQVSRGGEQEQGRGVGDAALTAAVLPAERSGSGV